MKGRMSVDDRCTECQEAAYSCEICQTRPKAYVPVKDAWLAERAAAAPTPVSAYPGEWAIGEIPGGIVAKWDQASHRFVGAGSRREPHPHPHRFAWLELTTACPHRCRHCYLGSRLAHGHAPLPQILQALSQMREFMVGEVVLTGGEPTMHPQFVRILNDARMVAPAVRVLTNGWTQRPEVVSALAQAGVQVETPLLGWQEDHDWMTRTPGSFQRVMTSLRRYHEAGVDLTLTTTLTRQGMRALPQLRKLANAWGIPFAPSALTAEGAALDHWRDLSPAGSEA